MSPTGQLTLTGEAFKILKDAMQADPEYAWSWQCNLAMSIYDEGSAQLDAAGIELSLDFCNAAGAPDL